MTSNNQNALHLLSELLVQIRGIAGDAVNQGHVSTLGRGAFSPEDACKAIYALADAGHNIPQALADGPGRGAYFLLDAGVEQVSVVGTEVFGDRSTFDAFMRVNCS